MLAGVYYSEVEQLWTQSGLHTLVMIWQNGQEVLGQNTIIWV